MDTLNEEALIAVTNAIRLVDRDIAEQTLNEMDPEVWIEHQIGEGVFIRTGYRNGRGIAVVVTPDRKDNLSAVFFLDPNPPED